MIEPNLTKRLRQQFCQLSQFYGNTEDVVISVRNEAPFHDIGQPLKGSMTSYFYACALKAPQCDREEIAREIRSMLDVVETDLERTSRAYLEHAMSDEEHAHQGRIIQTLLKTTGTLRAHFSHGNTDVQSLDFMMFPHVALLIGTNPDNPTNAKPGPERPTGKPDLASLIAA